MNIFEMAMAAKMHGSKGGGLTKLPEGYPYKEKSESEIVVLAETAVDVKNYSGYGIGAVIPSDYVPFVEGQKYFATWNGVCYETVASVFPDGLVGLMIETESGIVGIGDNAEYSAYSIEAGPGAFIGGGADTVSISTIGMTETIHPIAPEFLPEGYPYKTGGSFNLLSTDGDERVEYSGGFTTVYVKTSDLTPSYEEMQAATASAQGQTMPYTTFDKNLKEFDGCTGLFAGEFGFIVYKPNTVTPLGVTFPTPGIWVSTKHAEQYKQNIPDGIIVTYETIHTMAPEFLPEPQTVTFTRNAEGSGYIAPHTGAEIAEMAKRGTVVGKFEDDGIRLLLRYIGGMNGDACFVSGFANDNGGYIYIFDVAADSTSVNMGAISS